MRYNTSHQWPVMSDLLFIDLFYLSAYIQFEGSGQWPDHLEAIQHIRAAFHIKVAECIRQQLHFPAKATPRWLDVMKVESCFCVAGFRQTLENLENVDFLKNFRENQGNSGNSF